MQMSKKTNSKVWYDGHITDYNSATVPILTHSLQYASGIFEGIRAHQTKEGPAIFRLDKHIERFLKSAKIYGIELGFTKKELFNAVIDIVRANKLDSCYIRPFAFYNDDKIGLGVEGKKVSTFIALSPFGKYFEAKNNGLSCKVSSWNKISSKALPVSAKASGNYINSIIASTEAKKMGFDEAILLSENGYVAEGPGENIFLVKDGVLITPGEESDILMGITRSSIIQIAQDMGYIVKERLVRRDELYNADELFFCGTAVEITPILCVDNIKISASIGKITKELSNRYDQITHAQVKEYNHWLTFV